MNQFQLKILDPRKVSSDELETSNQLYTTWQKVFSEVVRKAGGNLDPDDYFRNQFVLLIYAQEEILGFSMCTEFDLRLQACRDHHYWKALEPGTSERLVHDKIHRVMSMEYLTVLPEWRKSESPISWAEVLVGLGLLYQDHFPLDAMIGTPRVDLKMDQTCARMGGIAVQAPILKMNYPCAVQIFSKLPAGKRRFENFVTQRWTQDLWQNRIDFRKDRIENTTKTAKQG